MPAPRLNPTEARAKLQSFRFADLFIEDLGWNQPASRKAIPVENEGTAWKAQEIAQLSGFRVFEITPADAATPLPDAKTQQAIWKRITLESVENILIFLDARRTQSLWLWMKREEKRHVPRRHTFLKGQPGDLFLSKLSALVVDIAELDDHGNLPITETANRVRAGLDVEAVTKAFFKDFQAEHAKLLDAIEGIRDPREKRWYASVLLNRLMFIWFLQMKRFLDGGSVAYLQAKLDASTGSAKNQFYSHFLRDLFFEGFAKPESKRKPCGKLPLGDVPYLNGGLFLPHGIESRIEGDELLTGPYRRIKIADSFFQGLFDLFRSYSWSLDDTPGGDDREINPDVLGYIFEKYINQKEFGAYYTCPEITEYLCDQTIHRLLLDAANDGFDVKQKMHLTAPKKFPAPRRFESMDDILLHADGNLCGKLLQDVIPRLSLLDPACGSGAFLVAAMKTLLGIVTALVGRCEALNHKPVLQWIDFEKQKHKAPVAYWLKKKIITENIYGVDIMEEATEIAKLRLFLALVASAESRDQLEPLPNIEFNILSGNSLIGLIKVDSAAFDKQHLPAGKQAHLKLKGGQGAELGFDVEISIKPSQKEKEAEFLANIHSKKYGELLAEKNRRIALYKAATEWMEDLVSVKRGIEQIKNEAREVLNRLLLAEFHQLGIEFHAATWDAKKGTEGKPEKRKITLKDLEALTPFHWAYEFDEVIANRGGFDAIITNPPWENFKPDAKEFFQKHSEVVTKNAMRLEDFEEAKADLIKKSPELRDEWLAYLSGFPHVNLWFRNAPQYINQTAIINGRKATTDLNLYKLFTEQTRHLLRQDGYCGIVIPSGIYTDLGATQLRRMLFESTRITGLFCFENRRKIFEGVDSRFKFVVLSYENSGHTDRFPARFMRHDVGELASFPGEGALSMEIDLVKKLAPDSLSLPEFGSATDVVVAKKLMRFPLLGDNAELPWSVSFRREFHMTDDIGLFETKEPPSSIPLWEGKMVHQFDSEFAKPRYWIKESKGRKDVLGDAKDEGQKLGYQIPRLAFRDIARNTDTRTLIASILIGKFCGNTLSLVSETDDAQRLLFLCALFNSFTVDWVVRQKVTAHCNFFYMQQLPIPRLTAKDAAFRPLVERAARLVGTSAAYDELMKEVFGKRATHATHGLTDPAARQTARAEIDALVAQLYDLTEDEFTHILSTFPLVPESVKSETSQTYTRLLQRGVLA
ncbi:MAG: Eco57I restriction-modification methylase domain-containing protein [Verrucomicrobiaceae bacterium]|nr:Eco57I restriction-modification methylase domain-containing protein [Verrucomicrobiaceae bacterium]